MMTIMIYFAFIFMTTGSFATLRRRKKNCLHLGRYVIESFQNQALTCKVKAVVRKFLKFESEKKSCN
jgi:hypothetical protein